MALPECPACKRLIIPRSDDSCPVCDFKGVVNGPPSQPPAPEPPAVEVAPIEEAAPQKSDTEILREAERRRGGCGAFLVGAVVLVLIMIPLWGVAFRWLAPSLRGSEGIFVLTGTLALGIAGAIAAANGFTKLRLRLTDKTRGPGS